MGWKERLHEDFSSGLGDLLSNAGNGTIVASGGDLVMTNPSGVDCNWWLSTDQNGPTVYRDLGRYNVSGSQIYMVEFYIKEHNRPAGSDETTILAILEKDAQNYWLMQNYYANSDYWNIGRIDADVWVNHWSGDWSSRYRPGWYRLYVHGGARRIPMLDYGNQDWLYPGFIGLAFSRDHEVWTDDIWWFEDTFLTDGFPVDQINFRIVKKTYGAFPQADATFNDLRVYEWEYDERTFDGAPNQPEGGASRSVGAEDHLEQRFTPDLVGDRGSLIVRSGFDPPRETDNAGNVQAGLEDESRHDLKAPGVPQQYRHTYPQLPVGYYLDEREDKTRSFPKQGLEDEGERDGWRLGPPPQYHQTTLDPSAHAHFVGLNLKAMYYYRTEGEPWANPTSFNFTGFAKDGFRYTNGVIDAGPVEAPWRQEAAFPSGNRSSRLEFPDEVLIVVTDEEVVLFDIDAFPAQAPSVWMRFELDSADYWMAGRNPGTVTDVSMKNGSMVTCTTQSSNYGGISIINFTKDGEDDCAYLIRQDGHWKWNTPSYDIRDRNTNRWTGTGVSPSLRIQNEYNYSVDIYDDHAGKSWAALGGEDAVEMIGLEDCRPVWISYATGKDRGIENNPDDYDTRKVLFDESGWLWYTIENKLFRAVLDYQGGILIANTNHPRQRAVEFPGISVTCLAQGRNHVYVGTDRGVFRVHKASLKANLAYTIADGGGGGLLDNPPDGELLAGESPVIIGLYALSTDKSTILQVQTKTKTGFMGGVTTIRLTDDYVLGARMYPDIPEDAVYSAATSIRV